LVPGQEGLGNRQVIPEELTIHKVPEEYVSPSVMIVRQ